MPSGRRGRDAQVDANAGPRGDVVDEADHRRGLARIFTGVRADENVNLALQGIRLLYRGKLTMLHQEDTELANYPAQKQAERSFLGADKNLRAIGLGGELVEDGV